MKKKIAIVILMLSCCFAFCKTAVPKYLVVYSKNPSWLSDDILQLDSKKFKIFNYNISNHKVTDYSITRLCNYYIVERTKDNDVVIGYSYDEKFNIKSLEFEKLNLDDYTTEPIYDVELLQYSHMLAPLPEPIEKFESFYSKTTLYSEFEDYYAVVTDMQNPIPSEKNDYYHKNLVLINKDGEKLAVLPFKFDYDDSFLWEKVEVSPNKKLLKIHTVVSQELRDKHSELDFYPIFIYEIIDDDKVEGYKTEILHFVKVGNFIKEVSTYKDYSDFNVKISNYVDYATCIDSRVRIRKEPNLQCETSGYLDKDENIWITERSENKFNIDNEEHYWYKIMTATKQTGWVYGKYLETGREIDLKIMSGDY